MFKLLTPLHRDKFCCIWELDSRKVRDCLMPVVCILETNPRQNRRQNKHLATLAQLPVNNVNLDQLVRYSDCIK